MQSLRIIAAFAVVTTLAQSAGAQESETDNSFKWTGGIAAGRSVFVRNLNGAVRVENGTGAEVEVRAEKHWRRGDPKSVTVTATKTTKGDVLVCAIWEKRNTRCDEDGYSSHGGDSWFDRDRDNDVSVEFTIRLPKGVKLDASTVNGGLSIEGATAQVKARTVNGSVTSEDFPITVQGRFDRRRISGKIGKGGPELSVSTVNGSINLRRN
ncbi:MAG TPA: hypothetical protein VIK25_15060 [Gemmatimonadaceae bacterium]